MKTIDLFRRLTGATAVLLTLALCGCQTDSGRTGDGSTSAAPSQQETAGEARVIEVIATDFDFDPQRIEVKPGEKVAVKLINKGDRPHNIEFELPSGEEELEQPVKPGETATLRFTAPDKPGEYTSYCPVGNHRERGMTATLVVGKPGAGG